VGSEANNIAVWGRNLGYVYLFAYTECKMVCNCIASQKAGLEAREGDHSDHDIFMWGFQDNHELHRSANPCAMDSQ